MGTGNIVKTDLYHLHNYVQNSMVSYPKELIIETLREFFSQDSYYHYQRDPWGFPKTPDHTDLDPEAGFEDDATTRLFIGEAYRYNVIYYPAILVRNGGSRSIPISFNRNQGTVQWSPTVVTDGYGNSTIVNVPVHFVQAGAWEGTISVEVRSRSLTARDELIDLLSIAFVDNKFQDLINAGVLIKSLSVGSPSETEDRNDKLFTQSITLDIRSEWRRQIPIQSVIDIINLCVEIGNLETNPEQLAPNLAIQTDVQLIDEILNL